MAANFGSGNTTRWYSVADNALLTLPTSGDWSIIQTVQIAAGANARYSLSTGAFNTANSIHFFISNTNLVNLKYNTVTNTAFEATAPANDTWGVIYACRRGGQVFTGHIMNGQGSVSEGTGLNITGGSDGIGYVIGGRQDLDPNRAWQGAIGWHAHVNGYGVTPADILSIMNGSGVLNNTNISNNLTAFWHFNTSSGNITDTQNNLIAVQNGTGWSDLAELPALVPTGSGGGGSTKAIQITLHSKQNVVVPANTGIDVAFFDQDSPSTLLAPVFTSSTESINSSGVITVNVDSSTSLAIGQTGWIVIADMAITPNTAIPVYSGRATIVGI